MKAKVMATIILAAVFSLAGLTRADIVELDLFSIGCPTEFDFNSPYWTSDFELGVAFTEISSVYIDWSGEITAGLATYYGYPDEPFPKEVGVYASLGFNPSLRRTEVWGGEASYPAPELFDCLSKIGPSGTENWSDLLDGQGTITVGYTELIMLNGYYVESGLVTLSSATLVVDGVIVPEPVTILLLAMGAFGLRAKYLTRRSKL